MPESIRRRWYRAWLMAAFAQHGTRRHSLANLLTRGIGVYLLVVAGSDLLHYSVAALPEPPAATAASGAAEDLSPTAQGSELPPRPTTGTLEALVYDHAVEAFRRDQSVGLLVVAVHGETSATVGLGRRTLDAPGAPDAGTLFEIGSITKTFTATALSSLTVSGRLGLDDAVTSYLPEGWTLPEREGVAITFAHLAGHMSGLPRLPSNMVWSLRVLKPGFSKNPYRGYGDERLRAYLSGARLRTTPGAAHAYSNVGAGLLGRVVAHVYGAGYEELIREVVCEPLGLRDTVMTLSRDQTARLAQGYASHIRVGDAVAADKAKRWQFEDALAGAGAFCSTGDDLARYAAANLGLTTSPLTPALELAHEPRFPVRGGTSCGLGWFTTVRGGGVTTGTVSGEEVPFSVVWHNGGTGGFRSFLGLHKASRSAVVVLMNTATADPDTLGLMLLRALSQF